MDYITKELTYYNGFTIEMVCKNALELVEQNCGYYSMILFSGCSLNLIPQQSEDADGVSASRMVSGSGVLLLSRNDFLTQRDADSKDTVNRILEYFQNSYIEKIRLDDLACKFATNRTTINAEFNRNFGTSAIAERTGFTDEAYFSRAFKKQTGKSPREYRLSIPFPYTKGNWCGYHL